MSDTRKTTPSLLESESRGGEIAQGGFTFQDGVVLASIPEWLTHDGFSAVVREAVGDTEVRFFAPGRGELLHLIESKNHRVTPAEFWREVERFLTVDAGSGGQFRLFTLACTGLSDEVEAVANALQRVRGPLSFYGTTAPVVLNSVEEFTAFVVGHGRSASDAAFLLDKMSVVRDFSPAQRHAEGLFQEAVASWLPAYAGLPLNALRAAFAALLTLVRSRTNQPITRREVENTLRGAIEPTLLPPLPPVAVHTASGQSAAHPTHLCFDWADFFGGPDRRYPSHAEWEAKVCEPLRVAKRWIVANRSVRRLALHGERRLSASLAVGSVFSAVSGFGIDLHYRGEVWATDAHPDALTPEYPLTIVREAGEGDQLAVAVGVLKDVRDSVRSSLAAHGIAGAPLLALHGAGAITSARQCNALVGRIKTAIRDECAATGAKRVHLFFAGPAHLALFLGHRLNAVAQVQCYEWTPSGYVPSCEIAP